MNEEMPDGWMTAPLGNLAGLKTGPFGSSLGKSDYVTAGTPVINPMHIHAGKFIPANAACVSSGTLERLSEFRLKLNDVVVGRRGEMGRCAVVSSPQVGWLCRTGSLILRPSLALYPKYLQRYLSSPHVVAVLNESSVGSTMVNLNQRILSNLSVPFPPLAEQKRIADKLEAVLGRVDACRARLDRIPALLKRFRQSVLAAATSGELTADWREENANPEWNSVSLGEVAHDFSYGTSAKSSASGDTPVLRMGNIQDGRLDWADLVYTSDKNEIEKYRLRPGDVLFNRTNSPELVGKTAVYTGERSAIYAGYIIRVRCSEDLLPHYLNYCLNSPSGRDYCWQVKTDGVSQSNINAKKLAAFRFDLPCLAEQAEIVRRVESLFALAERIEARLATAQRLVERLTPATLAKAFRGELVPQDPEDEPASVLLERLRSNVRTPSPKARTRKKG